MVLAKEPLELLDESDGTKLSLRDGEEAFDRLAKDLAEKLKEALDVLEEFVVLPDELAEGLEELEVFEGLKSSLDDGEAVSDAIAEELVEELGEVLDD